MLALGLRCWLALGLLSAVQAFTLKATVAYPIRVAYQVRVPININ